MYQTARRQARVFHFQRMVGLALVGAGLVLSAASALAQAPAAGPTSVAPGPAAPPPPVVERAYDDLSWTGRRAPVQVLRREARAALSAGRKHCQQIRQSAERQECLRVVQQDYQEMMARLKTRTARR